jgi:nitroimidazol reductase NimA-like FMN-containing flavoprotein (pyridoxamine 5'-phosphate oxidase superfamily)
MSTRPCVTFSALSHDAAVKLLTEQHFGRLAFTFRDRVDVEPISYVYSDGWLYARTSPGAKLSTVEHHPWVAFEIDEVEGRFDWRSVVVHGTIYFLDEANDPDGYEAAVEVLRSSDVGALTDEDAAPFRRHLFRVHVDSIVGRQAVSAPE